MNYNKIRKFLKKGNGELLGFVVLMPMVVWILMYLVSLSQIALTKQHLSYLSYSAGRAAVVAEKAIDAVSNAQSIIDASGVPGESVELSIYDITYGNMVIDATNADTIAWGKGVFITITVKADVDCMLDFLDGERSSQIVMMVERPVNITTGGGTP